MSPASRSKKGPPNPLRIDLPIQNTQIALALGESSASALSSATSESDYNPFSSSAKPRSLRNMKKLSLTLPSARSSTNSLSEPQSASSFSQPELAVSDRQRRSSVVSLPNCANVAANSALLHRKEEEGDPAVPYADGPVQIMPSIWLGSEDNARDWKGLIQRGIKSILNVAKEVASPFDSAAAAHPLRSTVSTPNFYVSTDVDPTYYPPHPASGRPAMHYLKLQWSHGQQDLVESGFQAGMAFTDAAVERGEGVLIHCQCGISRSATMAIALVMRAAAERSPSVPSEIWALKGMQGAYTYVKEKSKWIGPNMSLIYQLLDYERKLTGCVSPSNSERSLEEEWSRRRKLLDDEISDHEGENDRESSVVMQEAKALDKAMEDRIVARKASSSSVASSGASSGIGMGTAWRSRYGTRKRTGSIASNMTNGSVLSEDLVEEDEEQELLGVGGGFDSSLPGSAAYGVNSLTSSPEENNAPGQAVKNKVLTPATARPLLKPPPSAPIWKTSFSHVPPAPASATRSTFDSQSRTANPKRRPTGLGILPPVPSSPIQIIVDTDDEESKGAESIDSQSSILQRLRLDSRKPAPPPLHLRNSVLTKANKIYESTSMPYTPSQTLLVFPPSPTTTTRTPSTMTLTSSTITPVPFPSLTTPRVSTFRSHGGRTRSFIGLGAPPTPTTAFSKVDVRGYVGLE